MSSPDSASDDDMLPPPPPPPPAPIPPTSQKRANEHAQATHALMKAVRSGGTTVSNTGLRSGGPDPRGKQKKLSASSANPKGGKNPPTGKGSGTSSICKAHGGKKTCPLVVVTRTAVSAPAPTPEVEADSIAAAELELLKSDYKEDEDDSDHYEYGEC